MFECVRKDQSCRQETAIMTKWRASGRHPLHEHTADESRSTAGRWLQNSSTFLIRLRLSSTATDKGKHQSVTPVSTTNLRSYVINSKACLRLCMWVLELCVCFFSYFSSLCRRAGLQKSRQRAKELQHERARYISQRRTAISWVYVRPIYQIQPLQTGRKIPLKGAESGMWLAPRRIR